MDSIKYILAEFPTEERNSVLRSVGDQVCDEVLGIGGPLLRALSVRGVGETNAYLLLMSLGTHLCQLTDEELRRLGKEIWG